MVSFNFQGYVSRLSENPDKAETVKKYEQLYPGELTKSLKEQTWYSSYVSLFKAVPIVVPEECKNDFDWDLLIKLAASSFSSDVKLLSRENDLQCDLCITVSSNEQNVSKIISELWPFQVLRLYEIYIEENINLQILIAENEQEKRAIYDKRRSCLELWDYRSLFIYESEKDIEAILQ